MTDKRLCFPEIRKVVWEPIAPPKTLEPRSVLVKSQASLISAGTELAIYTGSHIGYTLPNPPFPLMPGNPGYALVGEVTAVGQDVDEIAPGQRVMMKVPHGTLAVADIDKVGLVVLPEEVTNAQGTLIRLAEICLTSVRLAPLQLGESVAIYGMGLIGQLAGQLFRLNGAQHVIGIDRLPARLAVAEANGLQTLNADAVDVAREVSRLTHGRGPDVVIEATGSPAVVPLCLDLVAAGGRVVLLGSTRGRIEIDPYSHIHRKGVRVIGAHETAQRLDFAPREWTQTRNLNLLADLFASGRLSDTGLISHTITPDEALTIYDALADNPQDYLGVVIDWSR